MIAASLVIALGVIFQVLRIIYTHPTERLRGFSLRMHSAVYTLRAFGWEPKLRITVSWYQCITTMEMLYGVTLPKRYRDWVNVFDFIDVDWTGVVLPAACFGNFQRRMIFSALVPLMLICILVGWKVVRSRGSSPFAAALSALGPSLLVVFLFAPSINRKVFQTWDCLPYEFSATEEHFYMRASIDIRCGSAEHTSILPTSFILLAIWPIGSLVLFAGLALRCRRRLLNHSPDHFIRVTGFLHRDFKVSQPEHRASTAAARTLCLPHPPMATV
jgi:hypothetical protein